MYALRCTKKLLARVGPPSTVVEPTTTTLGDWFAQPLALGQRRFILLAAEHSRLPVLMPARNAKHLAQTFPQELVTVLDRLQIPMEAIEREIGEMRECVIAATNNRSVLGTLNDFSFLLRTMMERGAGDDPFDKALSLCDTPVGPLGYDTPARVTARLLAEALKHATRSVAQRAITTAGAPAVAEPASGRKQVTQAAEQRGKQAARRTANTWITDMRHFLDEAGRIPDDLPGPAFGVAAFIGSIVTWVTSSRGVADLRTNVACRWSPARRPCTGIIEAGLAGDGETILWHCPVCGDKGQVRGWEGTPWDRRRK
ncbi:MAG: hypothetical protein M5U22_18555 [Thermoleophilia bacterium]|nr:hypothetical protein [Thermoleophilia bacterium]